jgi:hypothetical protein
MAKGQKRSGREPKKPKATKPTSKASAPKLLERPPPAKTEK